MLLVGECPWEEMTSIALDSASRSSVILLELLTRERGPQPGGSSGSKPKLERSPHDEVHKAAGGKRGALVIGDNAFHAAERYPYVYDLGEAWTALTGLPFVYAVWAGPEGKITPAHIERLQNSLREGLQNRRTIAQGWAEGVPSDSGMTPQVCEDYLNHNMHYQLGAEELSGASAFLARAENAGLLSDVPGYSFLTTAGKNALSAARATCSGLAAGR